MASRAIQPMPEDVLAELEAADLIEDYKARPFYRRNDYLAWIGRAKQPATRHSRITQMLNELNAGGIYMKMSHLPSAKKLTWDPMQFAEQTAEPLIQEGDLVRAVCGANC